MATAAARLLADRAALGALRRNLGRLPENRAVYEVIDFIADAVADPAQARSASQARSHGITFGDPTFVPVQRTR